MNAMRKHYRLTEEFTYGTLLIQSAYLPVGATPADGDWETEHTYDWDSPQETLRSLLSAMSDFAGALAGAQAANGDYAVKVITLNKKLEALEQAGPTPANEGEAVRQLREELNALKHRHNTLGTQYGQLKASLDHAEEARDQLRQELDGARAASDALGEANLKLHEELRRADDANKALAQALIEANNQRNDLRSQLVTATKAAEANPIYMSCMDRDTLLLQLDEMLREIGSNNTNNLRSAAVALIRKHAVPMRLMGVQPTLAECGNLMRAMLYMYYGGYQESNFNEEDKTRARKLHAFILAAKA